MDKKQEEQLARLVADELGCTIKDASHPESALSELGMDDWDKREALMDRIDEAFGIQIGEGRYAPTTIEALRGLIDARLNEEG